MGAWLTPRNTLLPHMCHHTRFNRSTANHMGVGRDPKNFGDYGTIWDPLEFGDMGDPRNTLLTTCVTIQIWLL